MIEILGIILLILAVLIVFIGLLMLCYFFYSLIKEDISINKYNKKYHEKTNT